MTDLIVAGASPRWISARLRDSWLAERHSRVFQVSVLASDWRTDLYAALAAAGARSWAARRSAARVLGLDLDDQWSGIPEVLVPNSSPVRRLTGVEVHRSRSICTADTATVGSLRTTNFPRTLIDLSHELPSGRLARVVDDALVRGLCTPGRLEHRLRDVGTRGRRGAGQLIQLLEPWTERRFESVAEASMFRLIERLHLPLPVTQFEVRDSAGRLMARLDFAWPSQRVALEVDGFRWHSTPSQVLQDRQRQNKLIELGWTIVRTVPSEMVAGGSAAVTLRSLLG